MAPGWRCAGALSLVLAALAGAATLTADDTVLEVFEIRNRPAAGLVDAVEPHVGEDGAVTAHGSSLIVRATPRRMAQIRRLVATLDVIAPLLRVTAERQDARQLSQSQLGGSVSASEDGVSVGGVAGRRDARTSGTDTQILLLMDGTPGVLDLGVEVPIVVAGDGVVATGRTAVVTGVSVLPRLLGDGERVALELGLEGGRIRDNGRVERETVRTSVAVPLGEWVEIADTLRELAGRGNGLLGLSRELERRHLSIRVRVDPGA